MPEKAGAKHINKLLSSKEIFKRHIINEARSVRFSVVNIAKTKNILQIAKRIKIFKKRG